ncbi:hypothetical protein HNO89_003097 [Sporosarcina luteola]|nr:hypothetical protein [Sporosarcina luteola]
MKNRLDEQGYALLVVLFLVVFILTVTAVFIRGSIGNATQEAITDDNQLSVVIAEMGVEFFEGVYVNIFEQEKETLWEKYYNDFLIKKTSIENDKNIDGSKKKELIERKAAENRRLLAAELKRLFQEKSYYFKMEEELPNEAKYSYEDFDVSIKEEGNSTGITISVYSIGKVGTEKKLFAKLLFEIPNFLELNNSTSNSALQHAYLNWKKEDISLGAKPISKCVPPVKDTSCLGVYWDSIIGSKNAQIYYKEGIKKSNNGNIGEDFGGSKLLAEQEVIFPNMNNVKNLKVVSLQNIEMKNVKNAVSLTIEAKGNMVVDHFELMNNLLDNHILLGGSFVALKSFQVTELLMYIGDDLEIKGDNGKVDSKITKSVIYVEDNLEIGKSLTLNNSLVCVKGNIDLKKVTFKGVSKLVVTDNAAGRDNAKVKSNINDGNIKVVSKGELKANCTSGAVERQDVWKTPNLKVNYN